MLENFLSQTREQVSQNIKKSIGNSNLIEEAMSYSALGDSKMVRAALIHASGRLNKKISKLSKEISGLEKKLKNKNFLKNKSF